MRNIKCKKKEIQRYNKILISLVSFLRFFEVNEIFREALLRVEQIL